MQNRVEPASLQLQDPSIVRRFCLFTALLVVWPCQFVAAQVDESPLPVEPVVAFENLKWTGWESDNNGVPTPFTMLAWRRAACGR